MYTFHVPKMSCGGCVSNIKKIIKKIDGEAIVEADLTTKTVKIESSATENEIVNAMTDVGYQPTL